LAIKSTIPSDSHGYCSLEISIDCIIQVSRAAKIVIVQVNPNMTNTYGDILLHVSEIDYFASFKESLIVLERPLVGPAEKQIGMNVLPLLRMKQTNN
jgi:4-hydroxybutyrate CoA-transferase